MTKEATIHRGIRTGLLTIVAIFACGALAAVQDLAVEAKKDLGGLTSQASTTLDQVNATEKDSSAKLAAEQQQIQQLTVALKHILQRADERLYGRDLKSGMFGQLTAMLTHSDALITDTDQAMRNANQLIVSLSEDMHQTVAELMPSLEALAKTMNDPAISATLANLQAASGGLADDTAQLKLMLQSGTATAQDVQRVADKVADEYTKTRNLAWALFKELLTLGGSAAQIVK